METTKTTSPKEEINLESITTGSETADIQGLVVVFNINFKVLLIFNFSS